MKTNSFMKRHRNRLVIGGLLLFFCAMCSIMTVIFTYSNNNIRAEYRGIADKRDEKVDKLAEQVGGLQKKLDAIPERTAEKTADKVKTVVKEDEKK